MKERIYSYLEEIDKLQYLVIMLRWEMDTIAPKKSQKYLIDVSNRYEMEIYKLTTSIEYIKLVEDFIKSKEFKDLSYEEKEYFKSLKEEYYKFRNVPEHFYEEYTRLKNESLNAWVDAKNRNDYQVFKPYLVKIIDKTKEYYKYMYKDKEINNLYDLMLNEYEKGIDTKFLDKIFGELKKEIIPIIKNLKLKELTPLKGKYDDSDLYMISKYLLDYIGFDNSRGALGIFTHGYTTKLNNDDVRIAFSNKSDIVDHMMTIIHEGGHGIFEQNIDQGLKEIPFYNIDKVALHESQSRFYENILGRNINFWRPIYKEIKTMIDINLSLEEFMEYLNNAHPSLIRTKADELTYCMHIIIRYEIEKEIFNGNIDLDNLDKIWNKKYKEYLGIQSDNDRDGILQDMHWSDGSFGYFPTYLLGTIFDGMLLEAVNSKLGDVDKLLSEGKIMAISAFLVQNIHKYGGAYSIREVSKKICSKDLEITPIVKYFKDKYDK